MLLLSLISLILSFVSVIATCPSNCHHGHCVNGECQCQPEFIGSDCSIPIQLCPDGDRQCRNGSQCVRNNRKDPTTNTYKYHCDCTKAFAISGYAGIQCEYAATTDCEEGSSSSHYAFCTNGGKCISSVQNGQPHAGCSCGSQYEGTHCQYLKGEAPAEDLQEQVYTTGSGGGGGLTGIAMFFIVLISLSVVGMFTFFLWKHKKEQAAKQAPDISVAEDLQLDEDGVDATKPHTEII